MTDMARSVDSKESRSLMKVFEGLLVLGMVFSAIGVVAPIVDRPGLGVLGDTAPSVDAELAFPVDFGDRLRTIETDDGTVVDADTAQAPVELGEPVMARFTFPEPTASQRVIWVLWQTAGPLLALGGLWLVWSILRSAKDGDPFVRANVRRLWILANLIAIGGTAYSMFSGFASMLMIQRSAAADLAPIEFSVSFLPLVIGIGVAVLAGVWQVGVGLRDDVEGTI